jgi:hypothetical protein
MEGLAAVAVEGDEEDDEACILPDGGTWIWAATESRTGGMSGN